MTSQDVSQTFTCKTYNVWYTQYRNLCKWAIPFNNIYNDTYLNSTDSVLHNFVMFIDVSGIYIQHVFDTCSQTNLNKLYVGFSKPFLVIVLVYSIYHRPLLEYNSLIFNSFLKLPHWMLLRDTRTFPASLVTGQNDVEIWFSITSWLPLQLCVPLHLRHHQFCNIMIKKVKLNR